MNILSDFVEVQSRIELLCAIAFFVAAIYIPFHFFIRKNIHGKVKELLKKLAFVFFAISAILIVRILFLNFYPDVQLVHGHVSTLLFATVLVVPVHRYVRYRVGLPLRNTGYIIFYTLIAVLLLISLLIVSVSGSDVNNLSHDSLLIAVSVIFLAVCIAVFYMALKKILKYSKNEWQIIERLEKDIFVLIIVTLLSLMLVIQILLKLHYIYSWAILVVFLMLDMLIFKAVWSERDYEPHEYFPDNEQDSFTDARSGANRILSDRMKADDLYDRLIVYFEQKKPYLRQDLKIREVALYLYSNKTYLSRIINDKHNQNFNQFVNYYRIEEVKRLFLENKELNIQELCVRSGFGSMATFSIAFRYYLGNTPADWCKEQKLKLGHD